MFKEMHPRDFSGERGLIGMYASPKPLPKPPSFMSASRSLNLYRKKMPFQVAYDGLSFYSQRFFNKNPHGKIVTRLLSCTLTVLPVPHV